MFNLQALRTEMAEVTQKPATSTRKKTVYVPITVHGIEVEIPEQHSEHASKIEGLITKDVILTKCLSDHATKSKNGQTKTHSWAVHRGIWEKWSKIAEESGNFYEFLREFYQMNLTVNRKTFQSRFQAVVRAAASDLSKFEEMEIVSTITSELGKVLQTNKVLRDAMYSLIRHKNQKQDYPSNPIASISVPFDLIQTDKGVRIGVLAAYGKTIGQTDDGDFTAKRFAGEVKPYLPNQEWIDKEAK